MSAYSLPRCSKCGNSSGPWRPTGETLPDSDEQALVCSTGCPAELAAAVDAMGGALPMPVGTADVAAEQDRAELLLNAAPAELTEQQIEALINAGNGALSNYYHERQCHCSKYPAGCVTNSGYARSRGYWDTDAFAIGLPAVIGLWEAMRNDRHLSKVAELRARVAELEAELRIGAPWKCETCGKANRRDVCAICETNRPEPVEDPCLPCGCPKRFGRHAYGCPTIPEDPHDSPRRHTYATPRDLPEVTR